MADHLASIYGTEKDKVNCSFYLKIGACRHGDRCSRKHIRPAFSQTILIPNVWVNPSLMPNNNVSPETVQEQFDLLYEDVFMELAKYGEIEEMNICDNVGDHLIGNIYARFRYEEDASKAIESLNQRFYAGRPLYAELSPVTDFSEACCRQYEISECTRGGYCNFMHLRNASRNLVKELFKAQRASIKMQKSSAEKPSAGEDAGRTNRSRSASHSRSRSRSRSRHRDRDRRDRDRRDRDRDRDRRDRDRERRHRRDD